MMLRSLTAAVLFAIVTEPTLAARHGKKGKEKETLGPFDYPEAMPSPPEMWVEGFASRLHAQNIQKYETPIQVWQTWRLDQIMWNCIASYHPTLLDALTKNRPPFDIPSEHHTSRARALCMIHAINKLVPELIPISAETISNWLTDLGLNSSIMTDEMAHQMTIVDGDYSPRVIGSFLSSKIIEDMQQDGWNYKGHNGSGGEVCTANCRPFTDTTGYVPENNPWEIVNPKSWQPLIESDGLGFFYAQEHVTPHIGETAKPVILTREQINMRELDDPNYDLAEEAENSIDTVALLDDSEEGMFRKAMISFMDNKINIAGGMIMRLRAKYRLSLEAQVFYHYGYTSTELDVVILSWKEKIRHNLIRPTSVVQAFDDRMVQSFAGAHKAKDWVPFIRYPSGSGCICLGIAQYIDTFLKDAYGDESISTTWNFPDPVGSVTFHNMTQLYGTCGDSRIWGGMHFRASVPDSYELCDGVGKMGYNELMLGLLGEGGNYSELMDENMENYMN